MLYEVHYTLHNEAQMYKLPEGMKKTLFFNLSKDNKPLFKDALITSSIEADTLNSAAKSAFSTVKWMEREFNVDIVRVKLETGPDGKTPTLYHEMHMKFTGDAPNVAMGHHIWRSLSDKGGKWGTLRSLDIKALREVYDAVRNSQIGVSKLQDYQIIEMEVESVVLDTDPSHESDRGWATEYVT